MIAVIQKLERQKAKRGINVQFHYQFNKIQIHIKHSNAKLKQYVVLQFNDQKVKFNKQLKI